MNGQEKDMGSTDDPGVLARQSTREVIAMMHDGQLVYRGVVRERPGWLRLAWHHSAGSGHIEVTDGIAAYLAGALAVESGVKFDAE